MEDPAKLFGRWLRRQHLTWQAQQGARRTIADFAAYLEVSRDTLNNWLAGRRVPRGASVDRLAVRLGAEVYDRLGLVRPDEHLRQLIEHWGRLTPAQKRSIAQMAIDFAQTNPQAADVG